MSIDRTSARIAAPDKTAGAFDRLLDRFLNKTLPKEEWTHKAHCIVGTLLAVRYGTDGALEIMREAVRAYNEAVGGTNTDTTGYHETLTAVWIRVLAGVFSATDDTLPTDERIALTLAHPLADKEMPLRYYSRECLFTPEARRYIVAPDLASLPF